MHLPLRGLLLATLPAIAGLAACDTGSITHIPNDEDSTIEPGGADGAGDEDPTGDADDGSDPGVTPPGMVTVEFDGTDEDFLNPERGYYVGLHLIDGDGAADVRASGHTLAIALVRLDDYRTQPIASSFLTALRAGFADVRAHGIKVILRFTYNSSYDADASREQIIEHIGQLAPIIRDNADVIAVMQAGFIGAWGEWHSSTNDLENDADRGAILRALLDAVPESRAVQIRTPMYKEAIFPGGPLDEQEAWSETDRARVGHHNDCFLASASDYGTFASPVATWESYVAQDARYVPVGGETCKLNAPKTDCEQALSILENQRWSYLNEEYNQDVLDAWVEQGCADNVSTRLGHRLSLVRATVSEKVAPGGNLDVELDVQNDGFAAPFNARPIAIVLKRGDRSWVGTLEAQDARQLQPGVTTVTARLRVPADLAAGDDYELALWLPDASDRLRDDPRYSIRLANQGVWDAAAGHNTITRALRVDGSSTAGEPDPAAIAMVELP